VSYKDAIRTNQAQTASRARGHGINVDDIRKESRGVQATGVMITRMMNEPTPTVGHQRIREDDFVGQTFDGTNNEFTVSQRVLGENIKLGWVRQVDGTRFPLTRTSNPAPSGLQFWFDGFFTIRVGTPPASLDSLTATYDTSL